MQSGWLFETEESAPAAARNQMRPQDWPPSLARVSLSWQRLLKAFWQSETGQRLDQRMRARIAAGAVIYPRSPYRALELTPFENAKVVVLGQDPYHGAGQAEGLAFSVSEGQKIPPSLRNIRKEIERDPAFQFDRGVTEDFVLQANAVRSGSLVSWAEQGVLLLNTALTVEDSNPASHSDWGWQVLTDCIVNALAADAMPRAFLLWGAHAQAKLGLIEPLNKDGRHLVMKANHPSPLSASRPPLPFLGCGHFGAVNQWLAAQHQNPVRWEFSI
jgi:uracil-DNA glycosylase